jgi:hypothetical protein
LNGSVLEEISIRSVGKMKGIIKGDQENRQRVFLFPLNEADEYKRISAIEARFDELSVTYIKKPRITPRLFLIPNKN